MDENDAISVTENLIEICKDGQKGYQDAAQHVKRTDLKAYCNERSAERGRFAMSCRRSWLNWASRRRKSQERLAARCDGRGSAPRPASAGATRRFWSRSRLARTPPR